MGGMSMMRQGPERTPAPRSAATERHGAAGGRTATRADAGAADQRMKDEKALIREGARQRSDALRRAGDGEDAAALSSAQEDVIIHLLHYAFEYDDDIFRLIMSRSDVMLERGRVWAGWREVVGYLHAHADSEILGFKGSPKQLKVLIKCKAFAVLFAYAMHRIAPEFQKLSQVPDEAEIRRWKEMSERLFDAARTTLFEPVYRYYEAHADDRPAWRAAPPFLTMMP